MFSTIKKFSKQKTQPFFEQKKLFCKKKFRVKKKIWFRKPLLLKKQNLLFCNEFVLLGWKKTFEKNLALKKKKKPWTKKDLENEKNGKKKNLKNQILRKKLKTLSLEKKPQKEKKNFGKTTPFEKKNPLKCKHTIRKKTLKKKTYVKKTIEKIGEKPMTKQFKKQKNKPFLKNQNKTPFP